MTKRDELVAELLTMGVNAEAFDKITNGVTVEGIRIMDGSSINPIVYPTETTTAQEVIEMSKQNNRIDETILTFDFAREHVKIGMMRSSGEDKIMRRTSEFDGIDEYMYVDGGKCSYKIPVSCPWDIPEDELWKLAERNTKADTVLCGMSEMIIGIPSDDDIMFVLTNKSTYRGAGNIIDKEAIRAKGIGTKFYAIPSSIHEWILVPVDCGLTPEEVTEIISQVNGSVVDPKDQLGDHVYILEV